MVTAVVPKPCTQHQYPDNGILIFSVRRSTSRDKLEKDANLSIPSEIEACVDRPR